MTTLQKYGSAGALLAIFGLATFAAAQTTDMNGSTTDTTVEDATSTDTNNTLDTDTNDTSNDADINDTEDNDTNLNDTNDNDLNETNDNSTDLNTTNTLNSTNATTQTLAVAAPGQYPAPMVLDIDGAGNALVRGVVQSTGSDSIMILTWGGMWTVRTDTGDTVIPAGSSGANDLSALRQGDFVGAEGTVSTGNAMTLDARLVRDWTTNPYTGPSTVGTAGAGTTGTGTSTGGTGTGGTGTGGTLETTPTAPTSPTAPSGGGTLY